MAQEQEMAILLISMLATYAVLLLCSRRYRESTRQMFRLEKSSLRVLLENPLAALAHLLSFFMPLYLMGLL